MPLTDTQRVQTVGSLRRADNDYMATPLWDFLPEYAPFVLSERRRRGMLQNDPEPSGDPEYS